MNKRTDRPFWKSTPMEKLTRDEWEELCDGCGRCCLQKFENRKTGKIHYTCVACYLLDIENCRCKDYTHRSRLVKDCLLLTPSKARRFRWLPTTCAYRLIAEGKELEWWHPLVSGDPETVHEAGISVRNRAMSEERVHPDDLEYFIFKNQ